jgi:hypothetical protein
VQRGRSLAPAPGLVADAMNSISPAFAAQLRGAWETVNNRWNQWVLNYSRGQQFDLLKRLGFSAPSWQDLASAMILLLCGAALAGAAWAWWDRRRQDPWQRLQQRVMQRLHQLGVAVQPHHAPRERAARVRAQLGAQGQALADELDALDRLRYASTGPVPPLADWWRRFSGLVREAVPSR